MSFSEPGADKPITGFFDLDFLPVLSFLAGFNLFIKSSSMRLDEESFPSGEAVFCLFLRPSFMSMSRDSACAKLVVANGKAVGELLSMTVLFDTPVAEIAPVLPWSTNKDG